MASINHALITQSDQAVGSSGSLSPILLSDESFRNRRAMQIDPNAAMQRFTPIEAPKIVVNTALDSMAAMANTMTQAAFKYNDKVSEIRAEDQYLKTELAIRETASKYLQTTSKSAVDAYDGFRGSLQQTVQDSLKDVDEHTRSKLARPLAKLQSQMSLTGAEHKAKQTIAWQGEVIQAKEVALKQNIFALQDQPELAMASIGQHLQTLSKQPNKSPEAILLEQDKFYSDSLSTIISTQASKGKALADLGKSGAAHFELAAKYIDIGSSEMFKADGLMLAKQSANLASAISEANNARIAAENRAEVRKEKAEEKQMLGIVSSATKTGDFSLLKQISNPKLQAKSIELLNTLQKGLDTPPDTLMRVNSQMSFLTPSKLMDPAFEPSLSVPDRITLATKIETLRKEDKADTFSELDKFAKSMVPPQFMGQFQKAEDSQQYNAIHDFMYNSVRQGQAQGVPASVALEQAKAAFFNDPAFKKTYPSVLMTRERLSKVPFIPDGGMLALDKYNKDQLKAPTTVNINGVSKSVSTIDIEHSKAMLAIQKKYGLAELSKDDFVSSLLGNPGMNTQYKADVATLAMQRRYYLDLAEAVDADFKAGSRESAKVKKPK